MVCIIFDCDGVIVDSEEVSCRLFNDAVLKVAKPKYDINVKKEELIGLSHEDAINVYRKQIHITNDMSNSIKMIKEYVYLKCKIEPVIGFKEFHERLVKLNIQTAVGTSGDRKKLNHNLKCVNVFFEVSVTSDDVKVSKPAPDIYLKCKELLDTKDAIVIEDSINGLKAGKAAGCMTIGITTTESKEVLEKYADKVCNDYDEIYDFLSHIIQ